MWISNRGYVFCVRGIRLHPTGDCFGTNGRYRQRYLRVRVFNNFVNNVDIEPWLRILCSRHPITSDWRAFECVDEKEAT